ncbi:hypothetical protein AKJ16_DCAP11100, partial [Drosera capensis]
SVPNNESPFARCLYQVFAAYHDRTKLRYVKCISKKVGGWVVRRSDDIHAETESPGTREELNLQEKTCTCRKWQVTG